MWLKAIFSALVVGLLWLGYAALYRRAPAFWASGLMTGVWFVPGVIAAAMQVRQARWAPGLVFICEALAAFISGAWGPLGWLSFQFGLVQGVFGEVAFFWTRRPVWVALAMALADLALLNLHPALVGLRFPLWVWALHSLGVLVSAGVMCAIVAAGVRRWG